MKIHIEVDAQLTDTEITIRCPAMDDEVTNIVASLGAIEQKLTGVLGGQTHILDASKVLYIDTADKKTFLYTAGQVYETPLRLYELEERLAPQDFLRCGKSSIVNFGHIQSLKGELDGRLVLTMDNGEQLVVSRQYAGNFKKKLGV